MNILPEVVCFSAPATTPANPSRPYQPHYPAPAADQRPEPRHPIGQPGRSAGLGVWPGAALEFAFARPAAVAAGPPSPLGLAMDWTGLARFGRALRVPAIFLPVFSSPPYGRFTRLASFLTDKSQCCFGRESLNWFRQVLVQCVTAFLLNLATFGRILVTVPVV